MKRWSSKEKKKVDVSCPLIFQHYNKHTGAVDLRYMKMVHAHPLLLLGHISCKWMVAL